MHIDAMFPSAYLKASDLQGRNVLVKIDRVEQELIGQGQQQEHKWVVYFVGKEKGVVLNKTNASNIAVAYGADTDDWVGKEIVLFTAMVDFQGRTVEGIRMRQPRASDRPQQRNGNGHQQRVAAPLPQQAQPQPAPGYDDQVPMDDEIPF